MTQMPKVGNLKMVCITSHGNRLYLDTIRVLENHKRPYLLTGYDEDVWHARDEARLILRHASVRAEVSA